MSSGPVHYVEAERQRLRSEQANADGDVEYAKLLQTDALIHAVLAVAAAVGAPGDPGWREVTG